MKTEHKKVKSFRELFAILDRFREKNEDWMFRGQADSSWQLVPKAGRPEFTKIDDLEMLRYWRKSAIQYIATQPDSDWDWLTLAQHHGLATRLLDWTVNPLAATYFAVNSMPKSDGALYCFLADHDSQYLSALPKRIDDVKHSHILLPQAVSPRVDRQMGRFTLHPKPSKGFDLPGELLKVEVEAGEKKQFLRDLNYYGINQATLFPDLDGLSAYLNWFFHSYQQLTSPDVDAKKVRKKTPHKKSVKKVLAIKKSKSKVRKRAKKKRI